MKNGLMLLSLVIAVNSTVYSQEKLEIEGAVILKDSEASLPQPGTIRFNPTTSDFEGWNGFFWISLTSGVQFETGTVTDVDGNVYKTVKIGDQWWMAENLKTSRYHNVAMDPISFIGNDAAGDAAWGAANYGAWCLYDGVPDYEEIYGKLYNWYAVNDDGGLCPTGWHVPSDTEWTTLTDLLGGTGVAGGKMKATGTIPAGTGYWNDPNTGATNSSGFTGLPGGHRNDDGTFNDLGNVGFWWSSTESEDAWYRDLDYSGDNVFRSSNDKRLGMSVRCVRD